MVIYERFNSVQDSGALHGGIMIGIVEYYKDKIAKKSIISMNNI